MHIKPYRYSISHSSGWQKFKILTIHSASETGEIGTYILPVGTKNEEEFGNI